MHHGEFIVYDIAPFRELMGRDVIPAFRLPKNDVEGDRYTLMTEDFLRLDDSIETQLAGVHEETYEHLGTVCVDWLDPAAGRPESGPAGG